MHTGIEKNDPALAPDEQPRRAELDDGTEITRILIHVADGVVQSAYLQGAPVEVLVFDEDNLQETLTGSEIDDLLEAATKDMNEIMPNWCHQHD